jgi:hypothetical protein
MDQKYRLEKREIRLSARSGRSYSFLLLHSFIQSFYGALLLAAVTVVKSLLIGLLEITRTRLPTPSHQINSPAVQNTKRLNMT